MSLHEITKSLQRSLAETDFLYEPRPPARADSLELLLLRLKDIKIKLYQETRHKLPHIHIDYGRKNHAASYSIESHKIIEGSLPKRYDQNIVSWLSENKDLIIKIWYEVQAGGNPELLVAQISENA